MRAKAAADEAHNLRTSLASAESAKATAFEKLEETACRVEELKERVSS
jgi:hypothetical protein